MRNHATEDEFIEMFNTVKHPNNGTYNIGIGFLLKRQQTQKALELLHHMKEI
eukprot:Pgem_evm2s3508